MKKYKLLIISSRFAPAKGGVEVVVQQLVNSLLEINSSLKIVLLGNIYREKVPGFKGLREFIKRMLCKPLEHLKSLLGIGSYWYGCKKGERLNVKIVETYMWGFGINKLKIFLSPFVMPFTILHFIYLVLITNPDIINVHFLDDSLFYGLIAKIILKKRVVISIHGSDLLRFPRRSKIQARLFSKILKVTDCITVVSNEQKSLIERMDREITSKITVITNGVKDEWFIKVSELDCSHLSKNLLREMQKGPFVLFYGRFVKAKGIDVLLKAWAQFVEEFPEYKLILAGDGEEKGNILNMIDKLNLHKTVYLPGMIDRNTVKCLLASCRFVVFPSRWEGSPVSIAEALAVGAPIIATRVGAIPDMITHLKTGLLIDSDDVNDLVQEMKKLAASESLRKKLSKNAREYAIRECNLKNVAKKYEEIYEKVLE